MTIEHPPQSELRFRASTDGTVLGYFKSISAAKRHLTVKRLKEHNSLDGYIDEFCPDHPEVLEDIESNLGWKCVAHRVCGNYYPCDNGWQCLE